MHNPWPFAAHENGPRPGEAQQTDLHPVPGSPTLVLGALAPDGSAGPCKSETVAGSSRPRSSAGLHVGGSAPGLIAPVGYALERSENSTERSTAVGVAAVAAGLTGQSVVSATTRVFNFDDFGTESAPLVSHLPELVSLAAERGDQEEGAFCALAGPTEISQPVLGERQAGNLPRGHADRGVSTEAAAHAQPGDRSIGRVSVRQSPEIENPQPTEKASVGTPGVLPLRALRGGGKALVVTNRQLLDLFRVVEEPELVIGGAIGTGITGTVYQGRFRKGKAAAIKLTDISASLELVPMIFNEILTYQRLEPLWGECVPAFLGAGRTLWGISIFLATEYLEGGHPPDPECDQVLPDLVLDAERKLRKIHELGILHNDIRRENMIVRRWGGIVFYDFGQSVANGDPHLFGQELELLRACMLG